MRESGGFRRAEGEEAGALDEAAEFFLGRPVMGAFARFQVGDGFVVHGHALEMDDADVTIGDFPDLALLELHWGGG